MGAIESCDVFAVWRLAVAHAPPLENLSAWTACGFVVLLRLTLDALLECIETNPGRNNKTAHSIDRDAMAVGSQGVCFAISAQLDHRLGEYRAMISPHRGVTPRANPAALMNDPPDP